ncbi:WYL domain-containing protein [Shewanella olleyana]|uniref:helix-turn-helix transcriptional regulator n=1 Tax=Shewanella olleyana TaxID=135626 RepID=UPI00200DFC37|nr:WYL domain-containing protein [Shewanella olleyana]MCL1067226.1 WYL domain-containing protein [Shewanella olleyana]
MSNILTSMDLNINKQTFLRYQLIEIIVYWEGRITTKHLCDGFGIGRQQASRDINTYLRELAENNLEYDMQLRGYKPSEHFKPIFTKGHVSEYLQLLTLNQNLLSKSNYSALGLRDVSTVIPPPRFIKPEIMRAVVRAMSEGRRLEIDYVSMNSPEPESRVIAPHSLVDTPLRWHVRAYCEKNRAYRDFVLSRFINEPDIMDYSPNPLEEDIGWCTPIDLVLQADPRLRETQKKLIETDFCMESGQLVIPSRLALINYLMDSLGLNLESINAEPNYQQICIKNRDELRILLSKHGLLKGK